MPATITIQVERDLSPQGVRELFFVPARLVMQGAQVVKVIDPAGDSRLEFRTRKEAEKEVRAAGFAPAFDKVE